MGRGDPPTPPEGVAHFQYNRTPKDRLWAVAFALIWVAAIAAGVYGVQHRNPEAMTTDFTDPASCPVTPGRGRNLMDRLHAKGQGEWSPVDFIHLTGRWLAVSAVLALGLGALFISAFKTHSHVMTKATIYTQIAVSWQGEGAELAPVGRDLGWQQGSDWDRARCRH